MKKYSVPVISILIFGLLLTGCQRDKMPITTSSEQALQYFLQGRDLTEKLRHSESVAYYQKAIQLDSNFALAYLYMSDGYISAKAQISNFSKIFSLRDKVSKGERLLIESVYQSIQGNQGKQEELLKKLVEMYPKDERLYLLLGNFYFSKREWEKALTIYNQALQIAPEFSTPYNQIGYCYRYLGDYTQAENAFKKYIKLIPNDPNPYDSYAELLLRMGEYEVSIENYEKALEINPNFINSYIGIATNLNFKKEYEEARKELKAMYRIARGDGEIGLYYYATAVSYAEEGNLDLARAELEKRYELAVSGHDTVAVNNALHTIAYILIQQGKIDEAEQNLESSYKLLQQSNLPHEVKQRSEERILMDRAVIALHEKDFTTARKNANAYKDIAVKQANTMSLLAVKEIMAMIDLEEKKYDQVITELENGDLNDASILFTLAKAFQGKGDLINARKYYDKMFSLNELNSLEYAILRHKAEKESAAIDLELLKK